MITMRITADVPSDRRLTLNLPEEVPPGPAEVVLMVDPQTSDRERARTEALDRFLALTRASSFRSGGPYPLRAELHERN